jgi:hypothetical protein
MDSPRDGGDGDEDKLPGLALLSTMKAPHQVQVLARHCYMTPRNQAASQTVSLSLRLLPDQLSNQDIIHIHSTAHQSVMDSRVVYHVGYSDYQIAS